MKLVRLIKDILPLSSKKREQLNSTQPYLSKKNLKELKKLLKSGKIFISNKDLGLSDALKTKLSFPQLFFRMEESSKELKERVEFFNHKIKRSVKRKAFEDFSRIAYDVIPKIIAPNILGFDDVKKMLAAQLFATDRLHILIIGDPSTGKTELIRSAQELSPISSFGLGSGISKAGLSMTVSGKQVIKGLLPLANGGVCAIDELNLIKQDDLGALYNAMEKGFVSYDKANTHKTLSADVRIMATANPRSKKFLGKSAKFIKNQIPFDPALLSRFHIIAVVFRPDSDKFAEIASSVIRDSEKKITAEDKEFIKDYIKHSKELDVDFPKSLDEYVKEFAKEIRENEERMIAEASPRHIQGVVRLAKSLARMRLVKEASADDIKTAIALFKKLMYIN